MRLALYGSISTVLTAVVLYSTFSKRSSFYTSAIQLSNSSPSLLILLNFGIFSTLMFGKFLQAIFFGTLRAIEVEHLYERSWFAVTETCLAMTIFRDEFDSQFVILFITLLFVKIFHWLCQDRIDFMEQSATLPFRFHLRMTVLMVNLFFTDLLFVLYAVDYTLTVAPSMLIVFGFEFAILATAVLATFSKYILHVLDSRTEGTWENKSLYIFYLELIIDFIKITIYIIFFIIVLARFGVPLHILRDIYVTLRSFLQKCRDLVRYRQATRNMNERYPTATQDELSRMSDPTCIICREEMVHPENNNAHPPREGRTEGSSDVPKKLPCGHIFHFSCLRSWLERQQSCPTCRSPVLTDSNRNNPPSPPTPPPQPPTPNDNRQETPNTSPAASPHGLNEPDNLRTNYPEANNNPGNNFNESNPVIGSPFSPSLNSVEMRNRFGRQQGSNQENNSSFTFGQSNSIDRMGTSTTGNSAINNSNHHYSPQSNSNNIANNQSTSSDRSSTSNINDPHSLSARASPSPQLFGSASNIQSRPTNAGGNLFGTSTISAPVPNSHAPILGSNNLQGASGVNQTLSNSMTNAQRLPLSRDSNLNLRPSMSAGGIVTGERLVNRGLPNVIRNFNTTNSRSNNEFIILEPPEPLTAEEVEIYSSSSCEAAVKRLALVERMQRHLGAISSVLQQSLRQEDLNRLSNIFPQGPEEHRQHQQVGYQNESQFRTSLSNQQASISAMGQNTQVSSSFGQNTQASGSSFGQNAQASSSISGQSVSSTNTILEQNISTSRSSSSNNSSLPLNPTFRHISDNRPSFRSPLGAVSPTRPHCECGSNILGHTCSSNNNKDEGNVDINSPPTNNYDLDRLQSIFGNKVNKSEEEPILGSSSSYHNNNEVNNDNDNDNDNDNNNDKDNNNDNDNDNDNDSDNEFSKIPSTFIFQ